MFKKQKVCTAGSNPNKTHDFEFWEVTNGFPTAAVCKCGEKWVSRLEWDLKIPKSVFDADATIDKDPCPYCGAPVFVGSKVAVWCSKSSMEHGVCGYRILGG